MSPVNDESFNEVKLKQAVQEVTLISIDRRLTRIENNISRILWAIGGLVLAAVVTFVINGGLNNAPPTV